MFGALLVQPQVHRGLHSKDGSIDSFFVQLLQVFVRLLLEDVLAPDCVSRSSFVVLGHFELRLLIKVFFVVAAVTHIALPVHTVIHGPVDHFVNALAEVLMRSQCAIDLFELTLGDVFFDADQDSRRVFQIDLVDVNLREQVFLVQELKDLVFEDGAAVVAYYCELKVRVLVQVVVVAQLGQQGLV